ncbi:MAG: 50S ribosomal protein L19e [Thermoplasmata archaeon]
MDLTFQKRLASKIFKCGVNRVYLDPKAEEDIESAISRDDVRMLIKKGVIKKQDVVGNSRSRIRHNKMQKSKGLRRGQGSRRGTKYARYPKKQRWMKNIRVLRKTLKSLRTDNKIDAHVYRRYYLLAKGGSFKNRAHLLSHLELKEGVKK